MLRASMDQWLLKKPEKKKKIQDQSDWGEPAKNPPMLKLVFSLELKNPNFWSDENLPSFDIDESFYSELWSGYLFNNFLNVDES